MQVDEAQRVLEVSTLISDTDEYRNEIKNAWRVAAKRYHPDTGTREPDAAARFAAAKTAYEVLLNASNGILPDADDGSDGADDVIVHIILNMRSTLSVLIDELVETQTAVDELADELERQRAVNAQLARAVVGLEASVAALQVRADRAQQQQQRRETLPVRTPVPTPAPTPAPKPKKRSRVQTKSGLDEAIEVLRNMRRR